MYVTKLYSELTSKKCLEEVPDGPNLGFLLIYDGPKKACCNCKQQFEISESELTIYDDVSTFLTSREGVFFRDPIILIRVLNQPLSSNQFYPIHEDGRFKGESFTWDSNYQSINPQPLNPQNIYQQVKITSKALILKSTAVIFMSSDDDHILPLIHQCKDYWLQFDTAYNFNLSEARGMNSTLRERLPELSQSVIVGKWYCPFIFVREGRIRDQVERSMYYEVTLEQRWEKVFTCKKSNSSEDLRRRFEVETEQVFIGGICKAKILDAARDDGIIWFTRYGRRYCGQCGNMKMGLRMEVVERMKYEQEKGGWKNGTNDSKVILVETGKFLEEPKEEDWKEYCCYVLVERFNFRRMDKTLALAFDFKHSHQIRTMWK